MEPELVSNVSGPEVGAKSNVVDEEQPGGGWGRGAGPGGPGRDDKAVW